MTRFATVFVPVPLKTAFTYCFDPDKCPVQPGIRVRVPLGNRSVTGFVTGVSDSRPQGEFEIREIEKPVDKQPIFGEGETELALWMEKFYLCSRGEALDTMIPNARRDSSLPPLGFDPEPMKEGMVLSDEQQSALDAILSRKHGAYYLYGVTGSGKTEVFLRVAEQVIARGRQVIYLVPEITLTHQLARAVASRFGDKVAILHSALTQAQRIKQWRRIRNGEAALVIGARSAVFAPCQNLGLVIIDEEHENSYKSGNTPRYHARQVAWHRCQETGALLLMGSATPSLECYKLAEDPDRLCMIRLKKRVAGGKLPEIKVVSILGQKPILSPVLVHAMNTVLDQKRQVILFLNRRGYNHSFRCNSCGFELTCPHCSVALTWHRREQALICHYCGYRTAPLSACPNCNSLDVTYAGFGTEKVEDEVRRAFPKAAVARLDTDVTKGREAGKIIDDFREGRTDILLGTQMVAKGLNFPNLALVGIVQADSTLSLPDFRSAERTFSLIVQVSGRSGRYDDQGRVLIQTTRPNEPAIAYAVAGKVDEFYALELENRRQTAFPPYTRLVQLVFRGKNEQKVKAACEEAGELFKASARAYRRSGELLEVLGPEECPVYRIAQNYRRQLLIRGENPSRVHNLVSKVAEKLRPVSGVYIEIDFDPLSLM